MRSFLIVLGTMLVVPFLASAETVATDEKAPAGKFGADGVLALPIGEWGDFAGPGVGAMLRYEHWLTQARSLTGRLGYIRHSGEDYDEWGTSYSWIPILVGVKAPVPSIEGLFASVEVGLSIISYTLKVKDNADLWTRALVDEEDDSSTKLTMVYGVGYTMGNFDFGGQLFFHGPFDTMGLAMKVGYSFDAL